MKHSTKTLVTVTLLTLGATCSARAQHDFHSVHGTTEAVEKLDYDELAAAAVPLDESAEGRSLAAECLKRYGGAERLGALTGARLTYRMVSFSADTIDVVKTVQRDRKYRIRRPGETRILNGSQAWFQNENDAVDLDGGRYRAELFSYLTLDMPLAMSTERFDGGVRYGTRDGDPMGYFYMEKNDSLMIVVGVDPADALIKSTEGLVRQGDQNFVFINRFSDHHDVEGIPFAYHLVNVSMGLEVGQSRLESVELNPGFDSGEFSP